MTFQNPQVLLFWSQKLRIQMYMQLFSLSLSRAYILFYQGIDDNEICGFSISVSARKCYLRVKVAPENLF